VAQVRHSLELGTPSGNLEFIYLYSGNFTRAEEAGEAWMREYKCTALKIQKM
jgi:hypothetical protein